MSAPEQTEAEASRETAQSSARRLDMAAVGAWIGTSLGITGVTVAVGYLIQAGSADLLGVADLSSGKSDYLRVAGRFLVEATRDLIALPGGVLTRSPRDCFALAVSIALLILAILATHLVSRRGSQLTPRAAAAVLIGLTIVKMGWFDLPLLHVRDLLLQQVPCNTQLEAPALVAPMARAVWRQTLCSRATEEPQIIMTPACKCDTSAGHHAALREFFVFGALAGGMILLASARVARRVFPTWPKVAGTLFLLCVGNALVVPLAYGKLRYPTRFPTGELFDTTSASLGVGYLLSVGADYVTLFDTDDPAVVMIPAKRISEIRLDGYEDVIRARLGEPHPVPVEE